MNKYQIGDVLKVLDRDLVCDWGKNIGWAYYINKISIVYKIEYSNMTASYCYHLVGAEWRIPEFYLKKII